MLERTQIFILMLLAMAWQACQKVGQHIKTGFKAAVRVYGPSVNQILNAGEWWLVAGLLAVAVYFAITSVEAQKRETVVLQLRSPQGVVVHSYHVHRRDIGEASNRVVVDLIGGTETWIGPYRIIPTHEGTP